MKSKQGQNQNQNLFLRIITSPIRAFGKAKDLYVRSLTDCAAGPRQNRRRNHHYSTGQQHYAPLPLPRSLSVASSITNIGSGEDLHELMRAASVRYYGHENEAEMYVQQLRQIRQQEREASRSEKALPKSVSVGMGFMGRIDEDNACEEFEDDAAGAAGAGTGKINDKLGDKYPRSKSYAPAVSKRLVVF
ncbi:hypothetical protein LINPERHAP1_LOCUS13499 [Linum perenne]